MIKFLLLDILFIAIALVYISGRKELNPKNKKMVQLAIVLSAALIFLIYSMIFIWTR